jgi:hypothetical protein
LKSQSAKLAACYRIHAVICSPSRASLKKGAQIGEKMVGEGRRAALDDLLQEASDIGTGDLADWPVAEGPALTFNQ